MTEHFQVRSYRPGDEVGIQELFAAVHRPRGIPEWRWRFRDAPKGPAVIHVVENEGAIVGHYAHVPFDAFVDGTKVLLGHGGDLMVSDLHRRKGLMKLLIEHYLAADMGFDLRLNFPTDQALRLGERYGAGRSLGQMYRWVRPRDPGAIRRLGPVGRALSAGRLIERGLDAFARHPRGGLALEEEIELGTEFDALASRSASFAPCIRVRDAAYLRWRWFDQPGPRWRLLSARNRSGELRG
jgi:GNAT superfamily N-acetyltransferase